MKKLSNFVKIITLIFVASALICAFMIPFAVNDMMKIANNILTSEVESTENITLDENIKILTVNSSFYIENIIKSNDDKIHIDYADNGFYKFTVDITKDKEKAILNIDKKYESLVINSENLAKTFKNIIYDKFNYYNAVSIAVPEDVMVLSNRTMFINPYTGEYYDQTKQMENMEINISDKKQRILEIRNIIDAKKIELLEHTEMELSDFSSEIVDLFSDELQEKINLYNLICKKYDIKDKVTENAIYKLNEIESQILIEKAEILIYKRQYKDRIITSGEYDKIKETNEKNIEELSANIASYQKLYESFCVNENSPLIFSAKVNNQKQK